MNRQGGKNILLHEIQWSGWQSVDLAGVINGQQGNFQRLNKGAGPKKPWQGGSFMKTK